MSAERAAMTDAEVLAAAIDVSGLSARKFAEWVLIRDERTVRRWMQGDAVPAVVVRWLGWFLATPRTRRATLVRLLTMPAPTARSEGATPETGA